MAGLFNGILFDWWRQLQRQRALRRRERRVSRRSVKHGQTPRSTGRIR